MSITLTVKKQGQSEVIFVLIICSGPPSIINTMAPNYFTGSVR
jgi:hypothetical protein